MKYVLSLLSIVIIAVIVVFCGGQKRSEVEYLRIHIRANSNSEQDQEVKYLVKDAVVEAMIPLLSEAKTKSDAEKIIKNNFDFIEKVAAAVLEEEGFFYGAQAMLSNEFFPTRTYGDLTLEEGNYDALILNLGSGEGDNWWCVVYPAFCFTQTKNSDNIVYISRIWEIIQSVKK